MGSRGPVPKPTELKVLQGNRGKRPLPKNEAKPAPLMPSCPTWLDKQARKEWEDVAPRLFRARLLTEVDGDALALYCLSKSRMLQAEAMIQKLLDKSKDIPTQLRLRAIAYAQQMRTFMVEFGLTPAARARIGSLPEEEDAELADVLS